MSGVTGAALIGGGVAAIGSVAGAAIGADAAGDAANTQANATRDSIAAQERMANAAIAAQREQAAIARQDLQPFRDSQLRAVTGLEQLAQAGNPFEQAQRAKATQAIQANLAAQGLLRSKNQVDLLSGLETDLAAQAYQQRAGILGGLAGTGAAQNAAGIATNLGAGIANTYGQLGAGVGSSLAQLGQQIGASQIARAQAIQGGFAGVNNAFQGGLSAYGANQIRKDQLDFQNALLNRYGVGGGGITFGGGSTGTPMSGGNAYSPF